MTVQLRPRIQAAVEDLKGLVKQRYPEATFQVRRSPEDPRSIQLWATVDVPDTTEVVDTALDSVLEYQVSCGLPVHVIPIQTRARVTAMLRAEQAGTPAAALPRDQP